MHTASDHLSGIKTIATKPLVSNMTLPGWTLITNRGDGR